MEIAGRHESRIMRIDEIDLWRRMAQRKDRFALAMLKQELSEDQLKAISELEMKLQNHCPSRMVKLWWDIAAFMKVKN